MFDQNKKTKILYVITKSNWGGAQKYVFDLSTNLPNNKFRPIVALGGNGTLVEKLKSKNIDVIRIANLDRDINIFKEIFVLFDLIRLFKKEQPDVVHLNSSKIGGLGSLAARLSGVPKIIFTAHGFAFNEDRSKIAKLILFFLNYITILWCHKTIVINKKEYSQVKHLPFIAKKLELIYIGIAQTKMIQIVKNPDSPLVIGTISELTKNKGLEFAIEAIARLKNKNITLTIIGEGTERPGLEKLITKRGITDKVQLLGFKENAISYLSLFDIFTLTSTKEGMPYSILEAGLAELPVVASNVGGIEEMIEDGKSGILVEPKNVEQIIEAISSLIDDAIKRKLFGSNLKKAVLEKFSIKNMIEKTKKVYQE